MKRILIIAVALLFGSCTATQKSDEVNIIPQPVSITVGEGSYTLRTDCIISFAAADEKLGKCAELAAEILGKATSLKFTVAEGTSDSGIAISPLDSIDNPEAYTLKITPNLIAIGANSYSGVFYALQSIMQMLPPAVYSKEGAQQISYKLPVVDIVDYPAYKWRGMHLDVSRHFFSKDLVLKYIDILAMHKMNTFHWHLTDDQGWRLEIKKYPLLTEIGAWRPNRDSDGWGAEAPRKEGEKDTYGGFFTQEDAREVVAYAAKRGITVVPEIEMPGHSWAAIASYPNLNCEGKPQQPTILGGTYTGGNSSLCPGNEEVYTMYQDILDEVLDIFPSHYIHIGGDEANKESWKTCAKCKKRMKEEKLKNVEELQSYLIKRMERYVSSKGRSLIGWDEILEGGLAPGATVMSWRGTAGGIEAAKSGHNVVMTPGTHLYFDFYQDTPETEPTAIGGFTTLKRVYGFNPVPEELTAEEAKFVLGAQANLWCEYILTPEHVEYMVVPRVAALSEILWTPKESRNFTDFSRRLFTSQTPRYDAMNINYHKGPSSVSYIPKFDKSTSQFTVELLSEIYGTDIRYTTDGTEPTISSTLYSEPLVINEPTMLKAIIIRGDSIYSKKSSSRYIGMHKGIGKKITYNSAYSSQYKAAGDSTLNDGFTGSTDLNDGYNQGIANKDMDIVYDLGESTAFTSVMSTFIQSIGTWVYYPSALIVYSSEDGSNFTEVGRTDVEFDTETQLSRKTLEVKGNFKGRYVRVVAVNPITPAPLPGAGGKNFIFVDEVFVN